MKKFILPLVLACSAACASAGLLDWYNGVKLDVPLPEHDLQFTTSAAPAMDGKLVLMDFWATWCAPCRESIPKLNTWNAAYGPKGLVVIGVSPETLELVTPFAQRMNMQYAVAVEGKKSIQKAFGIKGLPYAFFVNKAGKIVWRGSPTEITDQLIESLLAS
nr:TlpA disulfide reductase family protein [Rhodoferax sp.]